MATPTTKRTRSERVASIQIGTDKFSQIWRRLTSSDVLIRLSCVLLGIIAIVVAFQSWNPPFSYREGFVPPRAIIARSSFEVPDITKTQLQRAQQAREVVCVYDNRRQALTQLRGAVKDQLYKLLGTTDPNTIAESAKEVLSEMLGEGVEEQKISRTAALEAVNKLLEDDQQRQRFDTAMKDLFTPFEEKGLLPSLSHDLERGNQRWIHVVNGGDGETLTVEVAEVRIADIQLKLKELVRSAFHRSFATPEADIVADLVATYIRPRLPTTLYLNAEKSDEARQKAVEQVPVAMIRYEAGLSTLAPAGIHLARPQIELLRAEHAALLTELSVSSRFLRLLAYVGMLFSMLVLCGLLIHYQFDRSCLNDTWQLARILSLCVVTMVAAGFLAEDPWRAELIPLVICSITAVISFGRGFALMLMTALGLILTLSLGQDLAEFVLVMSASASTVLLVGRIRTRTQLIYVGAMAAAVVILSALGVGIMMGQSFRVPVPSEAVRLASDAAVVSSWGLFKQLVFEAARNGGFTLIACLLMTPLLAVAEKIFSVQTDLSLLELGDASHLLLRQLAQRAPGTYNHSIMVAALAEAAAESIGANGLLTRVGAYFHDIGKMFKPNYFVENQTLGVNCHDNLQPAMSTLVIIAHVKDGADLARRHGIPQAIIDFIEQHHGTTLVEYFFKEATKRSEESPHGEEVSETDFRYPGPKPQTLETAVLMLADAVESASRTLVDPAPARLQGLVEQIAMKRLLDGQFDECNMTLKQLELMKTSLVKSLIGIYHSRVKYPSPQTA